MSDDHLEYSRFKLNQHVYSRQILNIFNEICKTHEYMNVSQFHRHNIYMCTILWEKTL